YTLSDGGHLLHTTWSTLRQTVTPAGLSLGGFAPGVRICAGGRRIRFGAAPTRPQQTFSALRMPIGTTTDKARLSKLLYRLGTGAPDRALAGPEHSAADSFAVRGYSAELMDQFLRPYLAGLAADEDLAVSVRGADWLLRLLVRGRFAVAGTGVGAIARDLLRRLPPGTVRLRPRLAPGGGGPVASRPRGVRAPAGGRAGGPEGAGA